jgi:hypothetical protein
MEICRSDKSDVLTVFGKRPHSEPHERFVGLIATSAQIQVEGNMPAKSIRIYGVLSKITLAKDQPTTTTSRLEDPTLVKVKRPVSPTPKRN